MSKLAKLRNSPSNFFADSRHRLLRHLGGVVAPRIEASSLLRSLLEDPRNALHTSGLPVLARLAEASVRRSDARDRATVRAAGFPRVSIIMAARNAASTIAASITSLLAQTHANLEIIVVDDGSCDETPKIVEQLSARDGRVKLIRHDSSTGAALARNTGLRAATGAYLSFQDADDRSHPARIERQLAALCRKLDAVVCVCNFHRETAEGDRVTINGRPFARNVIGMVFPRRPVFEELGYMLDLRVGEDTEYYERIRAVYGRARALHLFQTLYYARYSSESLLFSSGTTRQTDRHSVKFEGSASTDVALKEIRARLASITPRAAPPYVPTSGSGYQ